MLFVINYAVSAGLAFWAFWTPTHRFDYTFIGADLMFLKFYLAFTALVIGFYFMNHFTELKQTDGKTLYIRIGDGAPITLDLSKPQKIDAVLENRHKIGDKTYRVKNKGQIRISSDLKDMQTFSEREAKQWR